MMHSALCTIVVAIRDRFSLAEASYESLCATTPDSFPVIYVDSCNPKPWAQRLDSLAAEGRITLIRTGFHLTQNEVYNLAIPHVRTKYVLFVDNELIFSPGWAEKLVVCAEETGASSVIPLYLEKEFNTDWRVHMCGGDCGVVEIDGELWFEELHPMRTDPQPGDLTRCQTGLLEFHAFLVRMEALQKIGPFDENMGIARAHAHFAMLLRASGGTIWAEPASMVKFHPPPPFKFQDYGCFLTCWDPKTVESSLRFFCDTWGVKIQSKLSTWLLRNHRRTILPVRYAVARWFGDTAGKIAWTLLWPAESTVAWMVQAWNRVPNRRQRLDALGSWRAPGLDPALVKAFAEKQFRKPHPLLRELAPIDEPAAEPAVLEPAL